MRDNFQWELNTLNFSDNFTIYAQYLHQAPAPDQIHNAKTNNNEYLTSSHF